MGQKKSKPSYNSAYDHGPAIATRFTLGEVPPPLDINPGYASHESVAQSHSRYAPALLGYSASLEGNNGQLLASQARIKPPDVNPGYGASYESATQPHSRYAPAPLGYFASNAGNHVHQLESQTRTVPPDFNPGHASQESVAQPPSRYAPVPPCYFASVAGNNVQQLESQERIVPADFNSGYASYELATQPPSGYFSFVAGNNVQQLESQERTVPPDFTTGYASYESATQHPSRYAPAPPSFFASVAGNNVQQLESQERIVPPDLNSGYASYESATQPPSRYEPAPPGYSASLAGNNVQQPEAQVRTVPPNFNSGYASYESETPTPTQPPSRYAPAPPGFFASFAGNNVQHPEVQARTAPTHINTGYASHESTTQSFGCFSGSQYQTNETLLDLTDMVSKSIAVLMEITSRYKEILDLQLPSGHQGIPPTVPLPSPTRTNFGQQTGAFQQARSFGQRQRAVTRRPDSYASESSQPEATRIPDIYEESFLGGNYAESSLEDRLSCAICMDRPKDLAFGCGHQTCCNCGKSLVRCPMCQRNITTRIKLYA